MEKHTNADGHVAVLYSPGFGAGWYSWNAEHPECLFDPEIVALVLADKRDEAKEAAERKWPDGYWNSRDLRVRWLPPGTQFRITEYDGSEGVETSGDVKWVAA